MRPIRAATILAAIIALAAALPAAGGATTAKTPKPAPATAEALASQTLIKKDFDFHNAKPQEVIDFISKESGIKVVYAAPKEENNSISMYAIPGPITAAAALHDVALLGNFSLTYKQDGAYLAPKTGKENKEPAAGDWVRIVEAAPFYVGASHSGMTVLVRYSTAKPVPIFVIPHYQGKEVASGVIGSDVCHGTGGGVRGFFAMGPTNVDEVNAVMDQQQAKLAVKFDGKDPFQPVKDKELPQFKTAGQLWAYMVKLKLRLYPGQPDFNANILALNSAATDFLKRFPEDPLRWEAKLENARSVYWLSDDGKGAFDPAKAVAELSEVAAAPDASADAKRDAYYQLARFAIKTGDDDAACKAVLAYHADHAADWDDDTLYSLLFEKLKKLDDAHKESLLSGLIKSDDKIVADDAADVLRAATAGKRMAELKTKPLDLKFTAVDGSEVDLSKMRGKVVLVDFWASWCRPCMGTAPYVVAAYKKYHDQGFEVVGISLDDDKEKMLQATKAEGMTWPQYFDGKNYRNEISSSYGIEGIPVMWLVNKKGMVTPVNITGPDIGVGPMIEKMLAE